MQAYEVVFEAIIKCTDGDVTLLTLRVLHLTQLRVDAIQILARELVLTFQAVGRVSKEFGLECGASMRSVMGEVSTDSTCAV